MTDAVPRPCATHSDLVAFKYPLPNLSERLKQSRKIKIVAIGSSSTAGVNGVIPYPHRLELLLRNRHYGRMIDVINRGISGQESPEELSRLECDVIAEAPSLVIWQVGTNAVYRKVDYNFDAVQQAIAVGLDWLARRTDVVLMDLQYTKAIVDHVDLAEDIEKTDPVGRRRCQDQRLSPMVTDEALGPGRHSAFGNGRWCRSGTFTPAIGQPAAFQRRLMTPWRLLLRCPRHNARFR